MVQDLVSDDAYHLETLLAAHRVDDHVAMNANEVLGVENAVLVLACCVDHLNGKVMVTVADDLAERVLDSRVVRVDEVTVDILDREGGFAWKRSRLLEERLFCGVHACRWKEFWEDVPTDLLPTMAILRCFCCGGMVSIDSERGLRESYDVVQCDLVSHGVSNGCLGCRLQACKQAVKQLGSPAAVNDAVTCSDIVSIGGL